ncbi:MAG: hypothetical protein WAM94_15975 [Chromatiaceae bacterium]
MKIAMPVAPVAPRASMTRSLPTNAVEAAPANHRLVNLVSRDSGLTERDSAVSGPLALLSVSRFAVARDAMR